jgi:hypothetical protein
MSWFNEHRELGMQHMAPLTITIDNTDPRLELGGNWLPSSRRGDRYGPDYLHDDNAAKGHCWAAFPLEVSVAGSYEVQLFWNASPDRASNVPVHIQHAQGAETIVVDQRQHGGDWWTLGVYPFQAGNPGSLTISNAATDGYVIVDAVRLFLKG